MTKNYTIKNTNLLTVLNKLQEFQETFETFVLKHHKYKYEVTIECLKELWVCNITINNEQDKTKVSTETIDTLGVF